MQNVRINLRRPQAASHEDPESSQGKEKLVYMFTTTREGGLARNIDSFSTLNRYLVLGIQDTYYQSELEALATFSTLVADCMSAAPHETVQAIVDARWKAPKPNACIVALAIACSHPQQGHAWPQLSAVVKNSSHMMLFVRTMTELRGWGRRPRRMIGDWYQTRSSAYDLAKYKQRTWYGKQMSVKRIFECVHKQYLGNDDAAYEYVMNGFVTDGESPSAKFFQAVDSLKTATEEDMLKTIQEYNLSWEMVPTENRSRAMWEVLLPRLGSTALLRNMGVMAAKRVDPVLIVDALSRASEHPINILVAWYMYRQGRGNRGTLTWTPHAHVVAALEAAFYRGFDSVPLIRQKTLIGLDVSSSMTYEKLNGVEGLNARVVAAVMAMLTVRRAPHAQVVAFSHSLVDFPITPSDSLETVVSTMARIPFGSTYTHLPIKKMLDEKLDIDAYLMYTDGQTWDDNTERLLRQYRSQHPLKYVEVMMSANNLTFTYGQDDASFAGFSADLPQSISAFLSV